MRGRYSSEQRTSKLNVTLSGARFGPRAIRAASARQTSFRGFNPRRGLNPYTSPYTIIDCGDIPITPFDNALALHQMTSAFLELGSRSPAFAHPTNPKPKLLTLGGDHSIALAALRALNKLYGGPIAVLHFDAHLDTWRKFFPEFKSLHWENILGLKTLLRSIYFVDPSSMYPLKLKILTSKFIPQTRQSTRLLGHLLKATSPTEACSGSLPMKG